MGGAEDKDGTTEGEPGFEGVMVELDDVRKVCQSGAAGIIEPVGPGFYKIVSSVIDQAAIVHHPQ